MEHVKKVNPERLKRLMNRMIDIYSPSGKEEEILEYIYGYLKRTGIPVQKQKIEDNLYNLLVVPDGEIKVCFIGHLDTVIAYDLDNYGFIEDGDLIKGLGAADMKGGCAAMVEAFINLWEKGRGLSNAALALVVGEEEEGRGTKGLIESGLKFNWAIIGEPTSLIPCLSSYGYLEIRVTTRGKRIHASLADHRVSPIGAMLRLIMRFTKYIESQPQGLIYNIRELYSSQAGFFVPDFCESWLDVHMPPESAVGEIVTDIEEVLADESNDKEKPGIETIIQFLTIDSGYELPEKGDLIENIKRVYERELLPFNPGPFRSHSDANLLWASGIRPIILGPGALEKAHSPEESISLSEVVRASEIYLDIAYSL